MSALDEVRIDKAAAAAATKVDAANALVREQQRLLGKMVHARFALLNDFARLEQRLAAVPDAPHLYGAKLSHALASAGLAEDADSRALVDMRNLLVHAVMEPIVRGGEVQIALTVAVGPKQLNARILTASEFDAWKARAAALVKAMTARLFG